MARSLSNPGALVAHAVVRLAGMGRGCGGFVITCLLICEYLSALGARSEEHRLVAKRIQDLCWLWRPVRCWGLTTFLGHLLQDFLTPPSPHTHNSSKLMFSTYWSNFLPNSGFSSCVSASRPQEHLTLHVLGSKNTLEIKSAESLFAHSIKFEQTKRTGAVKTRF